MALVRKRKPSCNIAQLKENLRYRFAKGEIVWRPLKVDSRAIQLQDAKFENMLRQDPATFVYQVGSGADDLEFSG